MLALAELLEEGIVGKTTLDRMVRSGEAEYHPSKTCTAKADMDDQEAEPKFRTITLRKSINLSKVSKQAKR